MELVCAGGDCPQAAFFGLGVGRVGGLGADLPALLLPWPQLQRLRPLCLILPTSLIRGSRYSLLAPAFFSSETEQPGHYS